MKRTIKMDSFIEYMIKQKKTPAVAFKKFMVYVAAFVVSLIVMFISLIFPSALLSISPLIIVALFYVAYRINTSFDIEFEYILTNGELDIDKITHKSRRKRLMTIHCKSFIEFGKLDKKQNTDDTGYARVIDAGAKSDTYDDYYAVFFKNGQKIKLIFNPTLKMIDVFRLYAPRVVK